MNKQQLKSQKTKQNIKDAASQLFLSCGYDKTSINDIVDKAGCSIGAFYGHFKSKQELATEIWTEATIEIIKESVEKGSRIKDREEFVDFLIMRSINSYKNKLTNLLFKHINYSADKRNAVAQWAARYTGMIRNVLRDYAPDASEDTVWSYASIIHAILNSHSQKYSEQATFLFMSDEVLRVAIFALMDACRNSQVPGAKAL